MGKTETRVKFFYDISRLTVTANAKGINLLPHCFKRSEKEQDVLYKNGKSKIKRSKHQDWLAIDFVVIKDGKAMWTINEDYEWLGSLWESMGHTWGGNWSFRDGCHFED